MARDSDSRPGQPGAPPSASGGAPAASRGLRLIRGGGQARSERLDDRHDVARLLAAAAADMLLKRISVERAHEIELRVDRVMRLFSRTDRDPLLLPLLRRELDDLEQIWRDGQERRRSR